MRVKARLRGWAMVETTLIVVGLALLGVFGWYQFEERYYQAQYQRELDQVFAELESDAAPMLNEPATEEEKAATAKITPPEPRIARRSAAPKNLFGRLQSEQLGIDVAVLDGLDTKTLRRAAGRLPRDGANQVIAAHRDSYFRPLRNVKPGDQFTLETVDGEKNDYTVEWMKVVEPNAVDSMAETESDALTLITCFPFDYVGSAPRRFIVRATAN